MAAAVAVLAAIAFIVGLVINIIKTGNHATDAALIGLALLSLAVALGFSGYVSWRRATGPPQ
jgi:hypothetical protein